MSAGGRAGVNRRRPIVAAHDSSSATVSQRMRTRTGPDTWPQPDYSTDWKRRLPAIKKTTEKAISITQHSNTIRGSGDALLNSSS